MNGALTIPEYMTYFYFNSQFGTDLAKITAMTTSRDQGTMVAISTSQILTGIYV